MSKAVVFLIGVFVGALFGIFIMCLVSAHEPWE
ncbi:MAG: DUF3789 domain-containing protein [Oscillospiraceae bacterium]|nr:DUF3789 domain-containing protein [Oscillospiraceae bacterium]